MTVPGIGEVVHGYRIVGTLGRGGLGTTFAAVHETTGQHVALKRLAVANVQEWKRFELFEREARVLSLLQHPAIPKYLDHFTVDGSEGPTLYLAQEQVAGTTLAELRVRMNMDEAEVRRIAQEILLVLSYIGQQSPPVIHRDIKPENVMMRPDGSIALVDFGAARADYAKPAGGSTTVGTYGYMAPEQLHGVATPATDIYGLACTLLFLLSGRSPAELPRRKLQIDFRSHVLVSPALGSWLAKALEPAPEDRFASADLALAALRRSADPAAKSVDFAPNKRMRPVTWALLGALVLALAGASLAFAFGIHRVPHVKPAMVLPVSALPERWKETGVYDPLKQVKWIPAHMSAVFSVAVSPTGDRIASASNDGTVKIWDLKTYEPIRALPGHTGRVSGIAWSPDGTWVASAGDTHVLVQDTATGATKLTLDGEGLVMTAVDVSRDGKWIVGGRNDGAIRVWSAENGSLRWKLAHGTAISSVKFSPDGRLLASSGHDTTINIWDLSTGAGKGVLTGHARVVDDVDWAPDGHVLASASDDHSLKTWLPEKSSALLSTEDASDEVWAVSFDPRGKWIATAGKEGKVRIYDAMTLKLVRQQVVEKRGVLSLAWAPDGKTLVCGLGAGVIVVLTTDFATKKDSVPPIPGSPKPSRVAKSPAEVPFIQATDLIDSCEDGDTKPLDAAEALLRDTIKKDPQNALAYVALSRALSRRADSTAEKRAALNDESEKLSLRGLELAPNSPDAHHRRAWLYYARRDDAHAREEALLTKKLGGDSRYLLAELALRGEDYDEAERIALSAIPDVAQTGLAWTFNTLQLVYWYRQDYAASDIAYQRKLTVRPGSARLKVNYAAFLVALEQYDRAIDFARQAIAIADLPAAHRTVASAFTEKGAAALWGGGDAGHAKKMFDDAVAEDRTNAHAHYGLGAYFRRRAVTEKKPDFLRQSSAEFDLAIKADKDFALARRAREDNDRLASTLTANTAR